jgi:hypothetical protein
MSHNGFTAVVYTAQSDPLPPALVSRVIRSKSIELSK